jgi:predicted nicotinamide N-methyase
MPPHRGSLKQHTPSPGEEDAYTRLPVPGLPGVYFRDMAFPLPQGRLRVLSASSVDVLSVAEPGSIPYWAIAWPAGLGLARFLAAQPLAGKRVLEIGCGVAVSGLGAALAGADVLVTDNEPPALRLALMNARRNHLSLRAAAADWRAWPLRERFDVVVGSDVTYEPAACEALLAVLEASLRPEGEALLTDPGRLTTCAFQQHAQAAGWSWKTEPLGREGNQAVFLHRVRRR